MKFLNYNKVLCLSPHPDDVEYGMLGTICKYKDTQFDVVVLSQGGDFDESTLKSRQLECQSVWKNIDNLKGKFMSDIKFIKNNKCFIKYRLYTTTTRYRYTIQRQ